ncbi:hypothetical protein ACP70R_027987 [Stipagrostis hirtigluma subsp. patula]
MFIRRIRKPYILCTAEHKQLSNLGSDEKQTIIETKVSVAEMLDQVTPMAKEMCGPCKYPRLKMQQQQLGLKSPRKKEASLLFSARDLRRTMLVINAKFMRHHGKRPMRAFARRMAKPAACRGIFSVAELGAGAATVLRARRGLAHAAAWVATQDANAAVATVPTPTARNADKAALTAQQEARVAIASATEEAYFRQIGEDVETHAATIHELKEAIAAFQSMDMAELARFHHVVERQLVWLTDETQVLARFDTLKGWKLAEPISQQLDRVEVYFNKIKDDVDMIERNEDEEMKRFQCHKSQHPLRLGRAWSGSRRAMVDLSSN